MAASGIETLRLACGGHGYSSFSGLGDAYCSYVATCTAEGDNFLLKQQTAFFLTKTLQRLREGTAATGCTRYLNGITAHLAGKCHVAAPADWRQHTVLQAALHHQACSLLSRLVLGPDLKNNGKLMWLYARNADELMEMLATGVPLKEGALKMGWQVRGFPYFLVNCQKVEIFVFTRMCFNATRTLTAS
jgi:hypothetical protein